MPVVKIFHHSSNDAVTGSLLFYIFILKLLDAILEDKTISRVKQQIFPILFKFYFSSNIF